MMVRQLATDNPLTIYIHLRCKDHHLGAEIGKHVPIDINGIDIVWVKMG